MQVGHIDVYLLLRLYLALSLQLFMLQTAKGREQRQTQVLITKQLIGLLHFVCSRWVIFSPGWPRTHHGIAWDVFKLIAILLPQTPECVLIRMIGMCSHTQLKWLFLSQ